MHPHEVTRMYNNYLPSTGPVDTEFVNASVRKAKEEMKLDITSLESKLRGLMEEMEAGYRNRAQEHEQSKFVDRRKVEDAQRTFKAAEGIFRERLDSMEQRIQDMCSRMDTACSTLNSARLESTKVLEHERASLTLHFDSELQRYEERALKRDLGLEEVKGAVRQELLGVNDKVKLLVKEAWRDQLEALQRHINDKLINMTHTQDMLTSVMVDTVNKVVSTREECKTEVGGAVREMRTKVESLLGATDKHGQDIEWIKREHSSLATAVTSLAKQSSSDSRVLDDLQQALVILKREVDRVPPVLSMANTIRTQYQHDRHIVEKLSAEMSKITDIISNVDDRSLSTSNRVVLLDKRMGELSDRQRDMLSSLDRTAQSATDDVDGVRARVFALEKGLEERAAKLMDELGSIQDKHEKWKMELQKQNSQQHRGVEGNSVPWSERFEELRTSTNDSLREVQTRVDKALCSTSALEQQYIALSSKHMGLEDSANVFQERLMRDTKSLGQKFTETTTDFEKRITKLEQPFNADINSSVNKQLHHLRSQYVEVQASVSELKAEEFAVRIDQEAKLTRSLADNLERKMQTQFQLLMDTTDRKVSTTVSRIEDLTDRLENKLRDATFKQTAADQQFPALKKDISTLKASLDTQVESVAAVQSRLKELAIKLAAATAQQKKKSSSTSSDDKNARAKSLPPKHPSSGRAVKEARDGKGSDSKQAKTSWESEDSTGPTPDVKQSSRFGRALSDSDASIEMPKKTPSIAPLPMTAVASKPGKEEDWDESDGQQGEELHGHEPSAKAASDSDSSPALPARGKPAKGPENWDSADDTSPPAHSDGDRHPRSSALGTTSRKGSVSESGSDGALGGRAGAVRSVQGTGRRSFSEGSGSDHDGERRTRGAASSSSVPTGRAGTGRAPADWDSDAVERPARRGGASEADSGRDAPSSSARGGGGGASSGQSASGRRGRGAGSGSDTSGPQRAKVWDSDGSASSARRVGTGIYKEVDLGEEVNEDPPVQPAPAPLADPAPPAPLSKAQNFDSDEGEGPLTEDSPQLAQVASDDDIRETHKMPTTSKPEPKPEVKPEPRRGFSDSEEEGTPKSEGGKGEDSPAISLPASPLTTSPPAVPAGSVTINAPVLAESKRLDDDGEEGQAPPTAQPARISISALFKSAGPIEGTNDSRPSAVPTAAPAAPPPAPPARVSSFDDEEEDAEEEVDLDELLHSFDDTGGKVPQHSAKPTTPAPARISPPPVLSAQTAGWPTAQQQSSGKADRFDDDDDDEEIDDEALGRLMGSLEDQPKPTTKPIAPTPQAPAPKSAAKPVPKKPAFDSDEEDYDDIDLPM